jgi:tRNA pseudouridine38-40 synthase
VHKLNSYLPKDIVVYDIIPVPDEAYSFWCDPTNLRIPYQHFQRSVLQEQSWYFHQLMSIWWMRRRNCCWNTDFQFSKVNTDVNTFDCTIFQADWKQENSQLVFTISANRFLRNMVRSIVGTLVNIGIHKITLDDF